MSRPGTGRQALAWIQAVLGLLMLLSLAPAGAQEFRLAHCYGGCPQGASPDNHVIIRPIYALSYNTRTRTADWVAYKVSPGSIGIASSLSRRPLADEYVSDTLQEADYLGAQDSGMIRAQYVPLVDFAATPYWNDVNYLTNSVARSSALSQGAWYGLDWAIRNLVNRVGDVYVLTGPIFSNPATVPALPTPAEHRVPDGFFKIVVTAQGEAAGFLFQQSAPVHVHHCEMQASIAEIAGLTGLDFFPDLSRPLAGAAYDGLGCN